MESEPETLKGADYVAKRLGMTQDSVRRLASKGAIPSTVVGTSYRFSPSAIEAYIAAGGNKKPKPT